MRKKTVLITGGAGGIGSTTAKLLAKLGFFVVVVDNRQDAGLKLASKIRGQFIYCDVTKLESVEALAKSVGKIDHVVSLAGGPVNERGSLLDIADEDLVRSVELNSLAHVRLVKALLLKIRRGGSVTFISSINARRSYSLPVYSLAKCGLPGLMVSLVPEFGARGIRINVLEPGSVRTPLTDDGGRDWNVIAANIPTGRVTLDSDIAEGIEFLVSCNGVNGHVLVIDSAQTIIPAGHSAHVKK